MTLGMTSGRGNARDQFGRGKGLLLRNATGAQCGSGDGCQTDSKVGGPFAPYPVPNLAQGRGKGIDR